MNSMSFRDRKFINNKGTTIVEIIAGIIAFAVGYCFGIAGALVVCGIVGMIYPNAMVGKIKINGDESDDEIYNKICKRTKLKVKENETSEELYKRINKKFRLVSAILFILGIVLYVLVLSMRDSI